MRVETLPKENLTQFTQWERIIHQMFMHPERAWWYAGDFMPPRMELSDPHFVGYEASSRISEILERFNTEQHQVFATEKDGRFRLIQVRWDNLPKSLELYPELIKLAESSGILKRYEGLEELAQLWKPEPKQSASRTQKTFKSYA